jgi:GAF domain-containing protein
VRGGLAGVLGAIVRAAARHCDADDSLVFQTVEGRLKLVAHHGALRPPVPVGASIPLAPRLFAGRAVLERRPIHICDVETAAGDYPDSMPLQRVGGARTLLVVPLLGGALAVGAIVARRRRVRPFTVDQADLLAAFAEHAALAMETARLRARKRRRPRHGA